MTSQWQKTIENAKRKWFEYGFKNVMFNPKNPIIPDANSSSFVMDNYEAGRLEAFKYKSSQSKKKGTGK